MFLYVFLLFEDEFWQVVIFTVYVFQITFIFWNILVLISILDIQKILISVFYDGNLLFKMGHGYCLEACVYGSSGAGYSSSIIKLNI